MMKNLRIIIAQFAKKYIRFSIRFRQTGYNKVNNIAKLLSAVYEAYNNTSWKPKNGSTFCNEAVSFICKKMGYAKFDKSETAYPTDADLANAMHDKLSDPQGDWLNIDGSVAQYHANQGALVIASQKNTQGHGHVCMVIPGELVQSENYGKTVPVVMNIGKDVFIGKGVSFAFKKEPSYFVLKDMA